MVQKINRERLAPFFNRRHKMSFEMRPLKTSDIYVMSKILKKMDLKMDVNDGTTQMEMGVQFIQRILENLHKAEKEVNGFMADLIGMDEKEFSELPITEVFKVFEQFKKHEGVNTFLELAGK